MQSKTRTHSRPSTICSSPSHKGSYNFTYQLKIPTRHDGSPAAIHHADTTEHISLPTTFCTFSNRTFRADGLPGKHEDYLLWPSRPLPIRA